MTNQIDRNVVRQVEIKVNAALERIAAEFGLDVEGVNFRFNSELMRASKIEFKTKTSAARKEAAETEGYMGVGTQFIIKKTVYTITAVNPHKPKNCYSVETFRGAKWVCGKDFVATGTIIKKVG